MNLVIGKRVYQVKQTGNKFFYFSPRAMRWLPCKKADVVFTRDLIDDADGQPSNF